MSTREENTVNNFILLVEIAQIVLFQTQILIKSNSFIIFETRITAMWLKRRGN